MNRFLAIIGAAATLASMPSYADDFGQGLAAIQSEWATANYQTKGKQRDAAFTALVDHAAQFRSRYPERAEALAWEGIVLSTYAGEVGAMSAMSGGIYASLGALYSKVPGGLIGFGDDVLAARYFEKALAVDPDNIDNNYFYGEFLLDQGAYAHARTVLEHALAAPAVVDRPVFDSGRREEIRALLAVAERKSAS